MKRHFTIFSVLFGFSIAHGATVNWAAYFDTGIINAGNAATTSALGTGNWVQIGYFSGLSNAQITTDAQTVSGTATLAAHFNTFSALQINTGNQAGNGPGNFSSSNSLSFVSNPGFAGSQIYLWALNSTNNSSISMAEATVTQQAIAYVPLSVSAPVNASQPWQFPTYDLGSTSIEVSSLQTNGSVFLAGSFIQNANNTDLYTAGGIGPTNNALQLAPVTAVPEPSTFAVGILTALAAAGTRRRRA